MEKRFVNNNSLINSPDADDSAGAIPWKDLVMMGMIAAAAVVASAWTIILADKREKDLQKKVAHDVEIQIKEHRGSMMVLAVCI